MNLVIAFWLASIVSNAIWRSRAAAVRISCSAALQLRGVLLSMFRRPPDPVVSPCFAARSAARRVVIADSMILHLSHGPLAT